MGTLRATLDPSCVTLGLAARTSEEVITALVGLLGAAGAVPDPALLLRDVIERERSFPTGLEEGCAIPHANSDAMASTRLAVARLAAPVDFGAPDGPASLVVLMAGPRDATGTHLKLLSKLARLLHDPEFREAAGAAPDAAALASLFHSKDG